MILIDNHLPALQVILPLFGGLFSAISFNKAIAEVIAVITALCCLILSIYSFVYLGNMVYDFGGWQAPIGIEYKLDFLNLPLFIYVNSALLFLLVFCRNLIKSTILNFIGDGREHLFFSILLFAHVGYTGMLSTNDLFNLYVFIEISSLSAYVLMAQGGNIYATRGAFDYLIIGSIGATLILIGTGFLLNLTGSLNISDIRIKLEGLYSLKVVMTASSFIIIGIILKMAFFPLHFWMVRTYNSAPSVILIYLASISGIIGTYIFLRFAYFSLDYNMINYSIMAVLNPISLATILFCSYLALKAKNLKNIIVYSAAAQTGYIILLLSLTNYNHLIFQFLILDGINKIALFFITARTNENNFRLNSFEKIFIVTTLISSAGLPLSGMFITKIDIIELLIQNEYWLELLTIVISSAIALLYHYKMGKIMLKKNKAQIERKISFNLEMVGAICLIVLQISQVNLPNLIKKYKIWDISQFPYINEP